MEDKVKQIIIVRKDLDMSPGKLAAQVSHASMAFLSNLLRESQDYNYTGTSIILKDVEIPLDIYDNWINDAFTKVIVGAKNKGRLEWAVRKAEELGMKEGEDFFLIRDNCLTELEPEDSDGRTLTCIGFRPMRHSVIEPISKKFQLLK